MKGWLKEDVTAILAIAYGAAISIGITAAILFNFSPDVYRFQVTEVAGMEHSVRPGSRVGVTATRRTGATPDASFSRVGVKDVEVVSTYRRFSRDVNARPVVVTLMANRRDAEKLESAATQGELNLVVR